MLSPMGFVPHYNSAPEDDPPTFTGCTKEMWVSLKERYCLIWMLCTQYRNLRCFQRIEEYSDDFLPVRSTFSTPQHRVTSRSPKAL